jgi:hypothetical protein
MQCQNCLSMLHYSTSGMLCRACDRLEPHNHTKKIYSVKCFAPLDEIEKYDLWCKTCLIDDEEAKTLIKSRTHEMIGKRFLIFL